MTTRIIAGSRRLLVGVWLCMGIFGGVFALPVAAGDAEAFRVYLSQAKKGSPVSQYMVARAYELGKGIPRDDAKAAQWYARSSQGGFTEADVLLGLLELEARGVDHNVDQGLKRLLSAAERGNILARYHLGSFYMRGEHVGKDLVEAYKWLFLASYLPRTPESFKAQQLIIDLKKIMSESQLKKAQKALEKFPLQEQN